MIICKTNGKGWDGKKFLNKLIDETGFALKIENQIHLNNMIWSLLWQNHLVMHKSLPSESDVCDIGASFPSSFCSCTLIKATLSWISHFCWTIYWYFMPQESTRSILKCIWLKYKPWRHCWLSTCDADPGSWFLEFITGQLQSGLLIDNKVALWSCMGSVWSASILQCLVFQ